MKNQALDSSLKKVAKGTGIVLTGTILGMLLGLASRVIITRYLSPSEYGLLYLSLTITGIAATVASFGFPQATSRYIAYYKEKNDIAKVWDTIKASLSVSFLLSIALFFMVFFFADTLATLFKEPQVAPVLKILSFIIPARMLTKMLVVVFRGFGDVKPKVYFQDALPYITKIPLVVAVIFLGWAFRGVVYATLLSFVAVAIIAGVYTLKKIPHFISTQRSTKSFPSSALTKELLFFSLPLFVTIILNTVISSTDTLMLGYFKTSEIVGFYKVAYPLARYIALILSAAGFIYFPIATGLYSAGSTSEMRKMYEVVTKWVFSFTLPLFFLVFLAPKSTLHFLFGSNYVPAASALRVLALGFFIHTFLGLNTHSLIVLGRSKFILFNSLMVAGLNVILNLQLIPRFGLEGAAFASAISLLVGNILASTELYKISGIHAFTRNYFKPILASCVIAPIYFLALEKIVTNIYLEVILLGLGFVAISLLSVIFTRSVEREDLMILRATQQKLGINLPLAEKALKKILGR